MKRLLICLIAGLILIAAALASPAQSSNDSSTKPTPREVILPNGEKISPEKIQKTFDRCADIAIKLRATNEENALLKESLSLSEKQIELLREAVALYQAATEELKLANKELKDAYHFSHSAGSEKDKLIELQKTRIAELEKKKGSLWKTLKKIAAGTLIGLVLSL